MNKGSKMMKKTAQKTAIRVKSQRTSPIGVTPDKETRINFIASSKLDQEISSAARASHTTKSGLIREAVKEYILKIEKNALEEALEQGYRTHSAANTQLNKEWEAADAEWPRH